MKKEIISLITIFLVIALSGCVNKLASGLGTSLNPYGGESFCLVDINAHPFPTPPSSGSGGIKYIDFFMNILGWVNSTGLMLCFIIPILGVFFISLGFLETLRIFKDTWINVAISILMGLGFTSLGPLNWIIGQLFRVMGIWGIGVFALMFFVGTYLLYQRRKAEWGTQTSVANAFQQETNALGQQLRAKREEYSRLVHELARSNMLARVGIRRRMNQLEIEINDLIERLKEMKEEYQT